MVLLETIDGSAKEENHDYIGIHEKVFFAAHETLKQIKIHVDADIRGPYLNKFTSHDDNN